MLDFMEVSLGSQIPRTRMVPPEPDSDVDAEEEEEEEEEEKEEEEEEIDEQKHSIDNTEDDH